MLLTDFVALLFEQQQKKQDKQASGKQLARPLAMEWLVGHFLQQHFP